MTNLTLYPYQVEGRDALKANPRFILGDEMGLGKTVEVLSALDLERLPAIVICPASVRMVWADEVAKWFPNFSVDVVETGKHQHTSADITVISYNLFGKVKLRKPKTLICDEAHYLQGRESDRTTFVGSAFASGGMGIWMLTGTPLWSRPRSLFPLLKLCGAWTGTYHDYSVKFCNAHYGRVLRRGGWEYGWDDSGESNLEELRELLAPVLLRRLKSEVLKQLPSKIRQVLKLTSGISAAEQELADFDPADIDDSGLPSGPIATAIRETAELKVPTVLEHVRNILGSQDKVVVFAWNKSVISALVEGLSEFGVVSISGGTNSKDRRSAVRSFQEDSFTRVFIGQTAAAGTGLTLTAASTVVFAQPDWTPANLLQAEDRIHRIGQKGTAVADLERVTMNLLHAEARVHRVTQESAVLVQYLVTRGSIEETMLARVLDKMRIAKTILGKPSA